MPMDAAVMGDDTGNPSTFMESLYTSYIPIAAFADPAWACSVVPRYGNVAVMLTITPP